MNNNIDIALKELALAVKRIINERIIRYGKNGFGENTLQGSVLQASMRVEYTDNGIELQIADYWEYVALGWKRTGRFPGTMNKFVKNIIKWINKKNIRWGNMSQNQMAFLIIKKIFENGIKARPFMKYDKDGDLSKMIPELNEYIDKWFDALFDGIFKELDNYFK